MLTKKIRMDFVNNWKLFKEANLLHMNDVNENIFILDLCVFQNVVMYSFITLNEVAIN